MQCFLKPSSASSLKEGTNVKQMNSLPIRFHELFFFFFLNLPGKYRMGFLYNWEVVIQPFFSCLNNYYLFFSEKQQGK